jgi:hypothetical protein
MKLHNIRSTYGTIIELNRSILDFIDTKQLWYTSQVIIFRRPTGVRMDVERVCASACVHWLFDHKYHGRQKVSNLETVQVCM